MTKVPNLKNHARLGLASRNMKKYANNALRKRLMHLFVKTYT